jgi:hypothetical protein
MILTPHFVYIHQPKTGGTFVTHVLSRLYGTEHQGNSRGFKNVNLHGTCSDIPDEYRRKPIVATVRNPYDRYVSQYRFGWWKRYPDAYCGADEMRALYPHYPDISFEQFVYLANTRFLNCHQGQATGYVNRNFAYGQELGWHTEQFVRFFFRDPQAAYARIDEDTLNRESFREDMFDVHFIATENLNYGLHSFLLQHGHHPGQLKFVLTARKVFPQEGGREPGDCWKDYYTPELKAFVRQRERLIFTLFPGYEENKPACLRRTHQEVRWDG